MSFFAILFVLVYQLKIARLGSGFINNTAGAGGGAYFFRGSLEGCSFIENKAVNAGGVCPQRIGFIVNTIFHNNRAEIDGGGMSQTLETPTEWLSVIDGEFTENSAGSEGGGISYNMADYISLENCLFEDNCADEAGGCYLWAISEIDIFNCVFAGNSSQSLAGAVETHNYSCDITNCTFYGNSAAAGGSIVVRGSDSTNILNSIFWNNNAAEGPEMYLIYVDLVERSSIVEIDYSVLAENSVYIEHDCFFFEREHMVRDAPCFSSAPDGDFSLSIRSPCIDNGFSDEAPSEDFLHNPRPVGLEIDIGAFEFQQSLGMGSHLLMEDRNMSCGDRFLLDLLSVSGNWERTVCVAVMFEMFGSYYFYPEWTENFTYEEGILKYGRDYRNILDFQWPEMEDSAVGLRIWSAVLDESDFSVIGELDCVEWCYF